MLRLLRLALLLCCLCVPGAVCVAQMARLEVISSDQGLSQGMIYDMLQDRRGFLWFGTRDGLNRYDGYNFQVYKNDPFNRFSISDNIIKTLAEDRHGRIWIGTESNGVDVFEIATGKFYHLSKGANGLPSQNINDLAETPDGAMWIATQNGLSRVLLPAELPQQDPDLNSVALTTHYFWEEANTTQVRANIYMSLLASDDGLLWVGTARDAFRFNPKTGEKTLLPVSEKVDEKIALKSNFFTEGPDGSVWLGQYRRMIQFKGDKTTILPLPPTKTTYAASLTFDLDGNLFVSRRKEIYFLSKAQLSACEKEGGNVPLPQAEIFCSFPEKDIIGASKILCDSRGLIWIGTNGYGIRKYNPVNRLFRHYLPGVSTRRVHASPDGQLWVWTSSGLFSRLDEHLNQTAEPILRDNNLFHHDCMFSRDGSLWILAQHRDAVEDNSILVKKNLQTGAGEQFKCSTSAGMYTQFMEDSKGNIWILGFKSDLERFDPVHKSSISYDLSAITGFKEYAFALMEDVNGCIWVGTPHGLVKGVPKGTDGQMDFVLFKNNASKTNSLNNNAILSVLDDPRNPSRFLWVGTRGGGLNLLDKENGECRHYTPADGLPNDVIYGILSDPNGYLWLSTNSGLSKFNPQSDHFENYSVADGLQDNEFNTVSYAQKSDGQMIFGGVNGLTVFDPKLINPIKFTPPVLITALKIQNRVASPGDGILSRNIEQTESITLPYDQNQITLEFAALDFSTPLKNQFRYRLLGAHNEWSEATTNHSTTYSSLPPGQYTFEVLTGGAHGMWDAEPARLNITILAPWWRSNLAYLLYFFLIAGMSWQAYRLQVRRIQLKEQLAFEHREAERIRAIEQMKTDFFSNITHELRTPLTLILEPLRQVLQNPEAGNWLSKVRLAEGNSRKLLQLVNQLLDLAKLEGGAMHPEYRRGQIADLLVSVAASFSESVQKKGITFQYTPGEKTIEPFYYDADKLEKIVTNLLSNALKFTAADGRIVMQWHRETGDWFVLEVQDSGIGIAAEDLPKVFDRFFSKVKMSENEQGSTGIGLALCRELAELMNGKMEVESVVGQGTTFRLRLPMLQAEHSKTGDQPVRVTPLQFETDSIEVLGNVTAPTGNMPAKSELPLLLLAEDNQELRHFIMQTLSHHYKVLEAVDGLEAIEMAREHVPDIIVSDLMMPRVDGIGLLDALKKDIRTSHIPVLMLTAKMELDSRVKGLKHGADAYLGKPFQTTELIAWLENLLESRRRLQDKFAQPVRNNDGNPASSPEIPSVGPSAPEAGIGLLDRQFLDRFLEIAEAEIDNDRITPEEIARLMAMSRSQLHRKLSALTGFSATEYLRNYRLDRAFELLQAGAGNVSEIAFRVGFVNAKHFSTSFKVRFGRSPSEI